jgi:ABC-type branched-subunit amino acid transport system ATPase component
VQNEGLGLLLIEHDIDFVTSIADEIAVLADGRILINRPVNRVVHNEKVREFYLGEKNA